MYSYAATHRPVGLGTVPKGFIATAKNPKYRFGTITYDRPLTSKEVYDFELTPLGAPAVRACRTSEQRLEALATRAMGQMTRRRNDPHARARAQRIYRAMSYDGTLPRFKS